MKATHIKNEQKITKVRVDFWISKDDIIVAVDRLLFMNDKITKKSIEQQIAINLRGLGEYSVEGYQFDNYSEAERISMQLYPDFF